MVLRWRPILILTLIAPLLTELLSTNVTLLQFAAQPWLYPFFATLGYGLPVLLIRETALRWRLGATGLCSLGLIYGIYNEGLWAKTFLLTRHIPVHEFESYGVLQGIALPWAMTICLWHALYAVVFPITIVLYHCPQERDVPWLGRKTYYVLLALIVGIALIPFFAAGKPPNGAPAGTMIQLGLYAAVTAALLLAAVLLPRPAETAENFHEAGHARTALLGVATLILILVAPIILAQKKIPLGQFHVYMSAAAALVFLSLHTINGRKNRMIFSLGGILGMALFVLVIGVVGGSIERCVSSAAFIVWAGVAIARVLRREQVRQAA
jgi:hypothetical protein